jgi:hypothetical protein
MNSTKIKWIEKRNSLWRIEINIISYICAAVRICLKIPNGE